MTVKQQLFLLLTACVVTSVALLLLSPPQSPQVPASWEELDAIILAEFQQFPVPVSRVRYRTIQVNSYFERKIYTVDVSRQYPQTRFHMELSEVLRKHGLHTYGQVSFPDHLSTIHILLDGTVVRTIHFRYADAG